MEFIPNELQIGKEEGFEKDIFGRKNFGENLENLISKLEDPTVIILDSPWGTGKTTFLNMWQKYLRDKKYPTIIFDAFKNDYLDNAFISIVKEISNIIEDKEERKNFVDISKNIIKKILPIAVHMIAKKIPAGEEILNIFSTELDNILDKKDSDIKNFENFKNFLSELPSKINLGSEKPLIFIIDELDRCKPNFALSMLETIKHFFSIPNIHFVISTNMKQMECSVKHVYGSEDPQTYLQKFYNFKVVLQNRLYYIISYVDSLNKDYIKDFSGGVFRNNKFDYIRDYTNNNRHNAASIFKTLYLFIPILHENNVSFRSINKIFNEYISILKSISNSSPFKRNIILLLCYFKCEKPELFLKVKEKKLKYSDIEDIYKFASTTDTQFIPTLGLEDVFGNDCEFLVNYNDGFSIKLKKFITPHCFVYGKYY